MEDSQHWLEYQLCESSLSHMWSGTWVMELTTDSLSQPHNNARQPGLPEVPPDVCHIICLFTKSSYHHHHHHPCTLTLCHHSATTSPLPLLLSLFMLFRFHPLLTVPFVGNLDAPSGLPWSDVSVAPPLPLCGILNLQALQVFLIFAHSPAQQPS